ncbi:bifunctional endo-1,4-beta-xylanase XylA-like [Salvia splendens]|uniref:bifunctional endo-1,4-beta-xylanase XylA-like n=1 Tax=Salvia splendens TaxID=180675 RepID=UPI001C25649E|nr:bifunctional endo-1,4-beta-xylanase XylA-like [Salvia splendens]
MEKNLLEAVEKARPLLPPAPKEPQYVPQSSPPEEHHYYYCEFPPEVEPQAQGKQRDAPRRDHPNFRLTDQNQNQPSQPSEGQPNWPARIQDRPNTGGNRMQEGQAGWSSGPQRNWSSGGQSNWSSQEQEGDWGYQHQTPQFSNQGRQSNNQLVNYVPQYQRGNQQGNSQYYQGNQQNHFPQNQPEQYGLSGYYQQGHGGG